MKIEGPFFPFFLVLSEPPCLSFHTLSILLRRQARSMAHSYFVGRPISAIEVVNAPGNELYFATASGAPKVRLQGIRSEANW